jgi:hypothetical protein
MLIALTAGRHLRRQHEIEAFATRHAAAQPWLKDVAARCLG